MGRIEIEVDGEGRFKRLVNREYLLEHFSGPRVFGALLDAAHSVMGPGPAIPKTPESELLDPGWYELRFFGERIDATKIPEPATLEPYHIHIHGSGRYRISGTSFDSLTVTAV